MSLPLAGICLKNTCQSMLSGDIRAADTPYAWDVDKMTLIDPS